MATARTCARHPDTETRLSCSACGTPICPRCSVATPVGQKCPDCARQPRSARASGKPRQYVKAVGVGLAAAAGAGIAFALWLASGVGFFTLIVSYLAGLGVGAAVRWGAEGNAQPPFKTIAVALAILMMAGAWLSLGALLPRGLAILTYPIAAFGAWSRFP